MADDDAQLQHALRISAVLHELHIDQEDKKQLQHHLLLSQTFTQFSPELQRANGVPFPLGVTFPCGLPGTINFAVVSTAKQLSLCIYLKLAPDAAPSFQIPLSPILNHTECVWHVAIRGFPNLDQFAYGYRVDDKHFICFDPHAKCSLLWPVWGSQREARIWGSR